MFLVQKTNLIEQDRLRLPANSLDLSCFAHSLCSWSEGLGKPLLDKLQISQDRSFRVVLGLNLRLHVGKKQTTVGLRNSKVQWNRASVVYGKLEM